MKAMLPTEENNNQKENQAQPVMLNLRRKGIFLGASFILLIALIIVGTTAWYTRVANVSGMTIDVAKFDVDVNYLDKEVIIDANDYLEVQKGKAAPGSGGVVPIRVSSKSEAEVNYTISLDLTSVAPEFLQRIRFYYYADKDKDGKVDKEGDVPKKYYLGGNRRFYESTSVTDPESGEVTVTWTQTKSGRDETPNAIEGKLTGGTSATDGVNSAYEYLYWEWIYNLDATKTLNWYDLTEGKWITKSEITQEEIDAHDDWDTKVGLGEFDDTFVSAIDPAHFTLTSTTPEEGETKILAYQNAMMVKLNVVGAQAAPLKKGEADYEKTAADQDGVTIYVADG